MEENRQKPNGPPRRGGRQQGNQQRRPQRRDQPRQQQREGAQNRAERPQRQQYTPKIYPRIRLSTRIEEIQLNDEQKELVTKYNTELTALGKPQAPSKEEKEATLNKLSMDLSKLQESERLINDKIESLKKKRIEIFEQNNPEIAAIKKKREEINRLTELYKELEAQKANIHNQMNSIKENQSSQQKRLGFKTKEDAEEAIDEIEYEIESSTLSNKEIKLKLQQIDEIKKKLPLFEKYQAGAAAIDNQREKLEGINRQLSNIRDQRNKLYDEIKELDNAKKPKVEQNGAINKEIDTQYVNLKDIRDKIKETNHQVYVVRDEFTAKYDEYHKKIERFYELTYLRDSIYSEAEKANLKKKEAERLIGNIVERENPHKAQISAGKALIAYLSTIANTGEAPKQEEVQKQHTAASSLENQLNDMLGGIQRKKPKAARKQRREVTDLTLPLETHAQFAELGMIPPKSTTEIPELLKKLEQMVKAYEEAFVKLRLDFAVEDNGHVSVKIDFA